MATTSYTYGGTALTTYGKVLKIDDDFDMPDRRDGNILIPFKDGEVYTQKYYSGRTIIFGIFMSSATATAMETLIDTLKTKLAPRTQQVLAQTREDGTIRNINATVDVSIQPERETSKQTRAVLTFRCTSPFWRLSTVITDNTTTIDASPKAMVVTNPGSAPESDPVITLTGPLANTVITNSTNGAILTYTGTIASPRVVTIQTVNGEYTATDDLAADKIGNVSHSGGASLLPLDVGTNTLSITDGTATTGTVKVSFYAPFT